MKAPIYSTSAAVILHVILLIRAMDLFSSSGFELISRLHP